jgi:CelD/BcsL family acetyltransferase involved in cellulose biosynthesis
MNKARGMGTAVSSGTGVAAARSAKIDSAPGVYEVDPLSDPRWQIFVDRHPQASVFHSVNWVRALKASYNYSPVVLTTCRPEATLTNGILFCRVESWLTGKRLVSMPFSDHCDPLASNFAEVDEMLLYAREWVEARRWKYIEIRPRSYWPQARTGFQESLRYRIHCLDLRANQQTLFNNFHKSSIQRKIRRAEREKLSYEVGTSESLLKKFLELQVITRRRQFLPPQPLSWFRALIDAFRGDLNIRVASKGDVPIASILTLSHKKSLVYKYGCSDSRFHSCGGMMLLFWNAIQEAKDKGIEELDMGRSDIENVGLTSFKEHWGAVGKPLVYWAYPQRSETALNTWQKHILLRFVPVAPKSILRMAGKHLYRHIG